jgi:hypothetical protein
MKMIFCLLMATFLGCANLTAAVLTPLVSRGDLWWVHKGTNAPQTGWTNLADAALNGQWFQAPGGFGFADNTAETTVCQTLLGDMKGLYSTLHFRKSFTLATAVPASNHLFLELDYDDGFVAYLDGREIARNNAGGTAGVEPLHTAVAPASHESSRGDNSAIAAVTNDLGEIGTQLGAGDHVLAVVGINNSKGSTDFIQIIGLSHGIPDPLPLNTIGGTLAADTTLYASNSPYAVTANLTVNSGVTLLIEPGVEVRFGQGLGLTVNGRLLAIGTAMRRIVFTRQTNATSWTRMVFNANPNYSQISYADIRFATTAGNVTATSTELRLDHLVFSDTSVALLDFHSSSFYLRDSIIPGISGSEPIHFATMPANGYALIQGCQFGAPAGYNDVIDFTGGNRPGPIVQFINNVFNGAVDECFDMDGTDAHIEGNIFLNVHQDATRASTANPIATGADAGNTTELVVARNIFYSCDHAVLVKEGGSILMDNNTIVNISTNAPARVEAAFINFGEPHRSVSGGRGIILRGDIFWDLHSTTPLLNFTNGVMFLESSHTIMAQTNLPGPGNSSGNPLFLDAGGAMTGTSILGNLALQPASPGVGAGPNGLDIGALVPGGASISGEPAATTTNTSATLHISGPGIYAYKWRLDDGPWSDAVSLTNSWMIGPGYLTTNSLVELTNLAAGRHTVQVIGMNSAGIWQGTNYGDGPLATNIPTVSRPWTVQSANPDQDGNGLPDAWEELYGLTGLSNAATVDSDGDGLINAQEYLAGTNPTNAMSVFRMEYETSATGEALLQFHALSNRSYAIESQPETTNGWVWLTNVPAAPTNRVIPLPDPQRLPARLYRLRTPAP